jgi:hypothetical protein
MLIPSPRRKLWRCEAEKTDAFGGHVLLSPAYPVRSVQSVVEALVHSRSAEFLSDAPKDFVGESWILHGAS